MNKGSKEQEKSRIKEKIANAQKLVQQQFTQFYRKGQKKFKKAYKESRFWKKIIKYCHVIGKEVIEEVLTLYYCMSDSRTPKEVKITILCALGYLILPLDLISDFIVPIGFIDDIAAIALVIKNAREHISSEHKKNARKKYQEILKRL